MDRNRLIVLDCFSVFDKIIGEVEEFGLFSNDKDRRWYVP